MWGVGGGGVGAPDEGCVHGRRDPRKRPVSVRRRLPDVPESTPGAPPAPDTPESYPRDVPSPTVRDSGHRASSSSSRGDPDPFVHSDSGVPGPGVDRWSVDREARVRVVVEVRRYKRRGGCDGGGGRDGRSSDQEGPVGRPSTEPVLERVPSPTPHAPVPVAPPRVSDREVDDTRDAWDARRDSPRGSTRKGVLRDDPVSGRHTPLSVLCTGTCMSAHKCDSARVPGGEDPGPEGASDDPGLGTLLPRRVVRPR